MVTRNFIYAPSWEVPQGWKQNWTLPGGWEGREKLTAESTKLNNPRLLSWHSTHGGFFAFCSPVSQEQSLPTAPGNCGLGAELVCTTLGWALRALAKAEYQSPALLFLSLLQTFHYILLKAGHQPHLKYKLHCLVFISKTQAFPSHLGRPPTSIHIVIHHYFCLALDRVSHWSTFTPSIIFHQQFPEVSLLVLFVWDLQLCWCSKTAGIIQSCSGHILGPIWVFQVGVWS